jgi:hypothetical protein
VSVDGFLDTWQFSATDPERVKRQNAWIELLRDGKGTLRDLLDATERRYHELNQPEPPGFFLYVDQGEELYVRAEEHQRLRFSEILGHALPDPRLRAMMSMRSDFLGGLQNDEPLFNAHRQINVPPLREAELRKVVSRPAELLAARFETAGLVDIITRRTAEDSAKDVGALPFLSYTLDDMWTQMVKVGDGVLRLPTQSFELGGVLVDRADLFLARHPGAEDALRRVLTLRLATVREGEEPTRRQARRSEFSDEEWLLVTELASYPNRLLATIAPESGETYAALQQPRRRGETKCRHHDESGPAEPIAEHGHDDLGQPFVGNPRRAGHRVGKQIVMRNRVMRDDPTPDGDVQIDVGITQEMACPTERRGEYDKPDEERQRDAESTQSRFGYLIQRSSVRATRRPMLSIRDSAGSLLRLAERSADGVSA